MTIVTAQMSVSVDGFYAGPGHADTQTWLEGPEAAGFFRVTRVARVIAAPDVTHIRYQVTGRHPLVLDSRGRDDEPAIASA